VDVGLTTEACISVPGVNMEASELRSAGTALARVVNVVVAVNVSIGVPRSSVNIDVIVEVTTVSSGLDDGASSLISGEAAGLGVAEPATA